MVTIETVEGMKDVQASNVELYDDWVVAYVDHVEQNNYRYIPNENVDQILETEEELAVEIKD